MTTAPDKGSPENPIATMDLPWTAPVDGWFYLHHRGFSDTSPPRPLKRVYIEAGTVVAHMSPSGTPLP